MVPLGYCKDGEKSARTFRTSGGMRYSFPGDMAMVAADGSLILLGRGSQVILRWVIDLTGLSPMMAAIKLNSPVVSPMRGAGEMAVIG